jgi:CBS domain-containing protein
MKVHELMTRKVTTVTPTTSLRDAAVLLAGNGISGMPVVSETGEVVGVLSEGDIVVKAAGEVAQNRLLGWLLHSDLGLNDKIKAETVGEAMSAPAVTISPKRPVHEAARLMVAENVNRLPVVEKGKLAGIVTRADIVRAFTRSDTEIADEIRREVLRGTFWLEPGRVVVTVVDGAATLRGDVETEVDQELLPHFVAHVPGVISVDADLSCRAMALAK